MVSGIVLAAVALTGTVEYQVQCAELAFSRSVQENDTAAFVAFVDADARFTGGETLRGKEEVAAGWAPFFEPGGPSIRWAPDNIEVLESGDLALSQGPFEMHLPTDSGEEAVSTGRFFSVWRRHGDGRWTVIFDGGTPARPADGDPFESLGYDPATVCEAGDQ